MSKLNLTERTYDINTITRGVITVVVLVCLYLLVRRLSGVLLPFLISWLLAYQADPIVRFFQYKCKLKNRGLCVAITILLTLGLISGIIAIIVPMISAEAAKFGTYMSAYFTNLSSLDFLPPFIMEHITDYLSNIDTSNPLHNPDLMALIKRLAPKLWSMLTGSMNAISSLAVIFICCLYYIFILLDYEKLSNNWASIIPTKYRSLTEGIISDMGESMNAYFRGQALIATCVGILFAIGFEIIGLPLGIVIGLFIGILNMVPYLQVIGIVPCAVLGLMQAAETGRSIWIVFICIAVVFIVVQLIQDMVLTPKIMGNVTGLHPAIILLALSIWGSLLGIMGMIIALPLTTVFISYYKRFVLDE